MRFILIALVMVAGAAMITPASAQHCVVIGCHTECWRIPGGQRCRERCTRRCWHEAPRYVQPEYGQPQQYYQPPFQNADFDLDPRLVGLALIAGIIVAIALITGAFNDTTTQEIAQIEESTFSARVEAYDDEQRTRSINSYSAAAETDAFEQGRRAADEDADEEWKEFTRHD